MECPLFHIFHISATDVVFIWRCGYFQAVCFWYHLAGEEFPTLKNVLTDTKRQILHMMTLNCTQACIVALMWTNCEPWVNRLSESGMKGVQVTECVRRDSGEGQSACMPVQKHPNILKYLRSNRNIPFYLIKPCKQFNYLKMIKMKEKTP